MHALIFVRQTISWRWDGKIVGRVAAIINHRANERWNRKEVRFGWFDFIDDIEVSRSLINQVIALWKGKGHDGDCRTFRIYRYGP